ncbi:hypothetical protein KQI84_10365 [bacterium]|nr:hypothetical protein [bacterium]
MGRIASKIVVRSLALGAFVALVSSAAATLGDPPPEGSSSTNFMLTIAFGLIVLLGIGAILLVLMKTKRQLEVRDRDMEAAEQAFEKSVLRQLGLMEEPAAEEERWIKIENEQPLPEPGEQPVPMYPPERPPTPPATGPGRFDAPPQDLDELVRRLSTLKVITDLEGRVPLAVPPDGLIYRLCKGGLVLLLPRMESEAAIAHMTKRFDMVIAMTGSGDVVVLSRLQNRLAELMESPGDFDQNLGHLLGKKP